MAFRFSRGELVGASLLMQKVYQEIDLAAASNSPVLITGETGTGKELAARAIHELSPRKNGPFIAVNMGALPKDLVESQLFGREKGHVTGADATKRGRFTLAQGGTLFLDELTSLPLELQPKLLRAIETKEIWTLGAEKPEQVQVRPMAATNANIDARSEEHTSELQSLRHLVCRLLLEKKKKKKNYTTSIHIISKKDAYDNENNDQESD